MHWLRKTHRSLPILFSLPVVLFLTIGSITTADAVWHPIMNESFENTGNTWNWVQPPAGYANSHPWIVVPWDNNPHWGIQNRIYRFDPSNPNVNIQSAWCDASNTQTIPSRDPEFDRYRTDMHTQMRWGPFSTDSIRFVNNGAFIQVQNAKCSFDWLNRTAPGDTVFWEAAYSNTNTPPDPISQRNRWFTAVYTAPLFDTSGLYIGDTLMRGFHCGRADTYWQDGTIGLDSLDSAGTILSLLNKPFVWVGWRFKSNGIYDSLRGAFVDNVSVSIDDGLFDLEAEASYMVHARSNMVIQTAQTNDTVRFVLPYRISGSGIMHDGNGQPIYAHARCYYDRMMLFDTLLLMDAGQNGRYDSIRTPEFIVTPTGDHVVQWALDPDSVILESNESNNNNQYLFTATPRNMPPTITLRSFTENDTITLHRQLGQPNWIPVIVETHDPDDQAMWYLFFSSERIPESGTPAALNLPWPILEHDGVDTVMWNIGSIPDGYWYLSGMIQDAVNENVVVFANACIEIAATAAPEPGNSQLPTETTIASAYPNPFNSEISFTVGIRERGSAQIQIFDVTGRQVADIPLQTAPGWQTIRWQPQSAANGEYLARLSVNGRVVSVRKVLYLK